MWGEWNKDGKLHGSSYKTNSKAHVTNCRAQVMLAMKLSRQKKGGRGGGASLLLHKQACDLHLSEMERTLVYGYLRL